MVRGQRTHCFININSMHQSMWINRGGGYYQDNLTWTLVYIQGQECFETILSAITRSIDIKIVEMYVIGRGFEVYWKDFLQLDNMEWLKFC